MCIISIMSELDQTRTHELLAALGEQLAVGLISRTTRDVDIVALLSGQTLIEPRPLPTELVAARDRVARDFGLPESWLNAAPADLLDFGLPDGFVDRLERRDYGAALTVH